jgi:hypothetical protein
MIGKKSGNYGTQFKWPAVSMLSDVGQATAAQWRAGSQKKGLLIVLKREKERTTWLVGLERAKMIGASLSLAISLMISGVNTFKMNVCC